MNTRSRSAKGGREDPAARGIFLTVFTAWAKTRSDIISTTEMTRKVEPTESAIYNRMKVRDDWRGIVKRLGNC